MTKTITFTELRKVKDSLPNGSMHKIAEKLNLSVETVRNYFGGQNYNRGESCGIHIEAGAQGGIVSLDDTTILNLALDMIEQNQK